MLGEDKMQSYANNCNNVTIDQDCVVNYWPMDKNTASPQVQ